MRKVEIKKFSYGKNETRIKAREITKKDYKENKSQNQKTSKKNRKSTVKSATG